MTKIDLLKSKQPIFIPKVQDSHIASLGIMLPAVLMDSRHIEWRASVVKKVRDVTKILFIDPATDVLLFKNASEGRGFKKLGHPQNIEPEKIYSDANFRNKIIETAIQYQISKGADVVIAPYLYAEDTENIKFSVNLTLLSETIRYLEQQNIKLPVFAQIEIGNTVLNRRTAINFIVDRYSDFNSNIQGFFITINDLDCKKTNEDSLINLANLVSQLSRKKYVFVTNIGGFGEVLSALFASGFSSGLASGENFSVKNLQEPPGGWSDKIAKTYISEILDYVNDEVVKKIGYKCFCNICAGSYPLDAPAKKKHYACKKLSAAEALSKLSATDRIKFIENKLREGLKFAQNITDKYGYDLKPSYLKKWLYVVEAVQHWTTEERSEELEELLKELES